MMCGIFGVISTSPGNNKKASKIAEKLMRASTKRGQDASGVFLCNAKKVSIFKSDNKALKLWRNKTFKKELVEIISEDQKNQPLIISGHTRMITHGDSHDSVNNQPVEIIYGIYILHNGVIVNWEELALKYKIGNYYIKSDTVIFAEIIKIEMEKLGNIFDAFNFCAKLIEGANNIVVLDSNDSNILFYSSNGSLYYLKTKENLQLIFASEKSIIQNQVKVNHENEIIQFSKNVVIKLSEIYADNSLILSKNEISLENNQKKVSNFIINKKPQSHKVNQFVPPNLEFLENLERSIDYKKIKALKRCSKCVLPETFPNIIFNENGICNICLNYEKKRILGKIELETKFDSKKDLVIVPLSGGRDSSYALHYLKEELNLNVMAYTYDWGFVSNSARENISRMCGQLKVEHLLLAANIDKKRCNVKKNLVAWLHRPVLGMIPILMAGDKQFLTLAEKLRKENEAKVSIFAMNHFERTGFKSGFADVSENFDKKRFHGLSTKGRMKIFIFYLKEVLKNTKYLNASIFDSIFGFFSFYGVKTNYLQIFDFIEWNEDEIMNVLTAKYDWKLGEGQTSSWRSGDATAGFYNYLYLRFAGLTEFDTFRSNQIRESNLDRSTALEMVERENKIQTKDLLEYLKTIDLSPEFVFKKLGSRGKFATI